MSPLTDRLKSLSEEKYKRFSQSLLPEVRNVLGVRLPVLRKIAAEEAKKDWKAFLNSLGDDTFEERMLYGMTLGYAKAPLAETLPYIELFLPKIDNWSVCDTFCCTLKSVRKFPEDGWKLIRRLLSDKREFYVRAGIVLMLAHFVQETGVDDVLKQTAAVRDERYYVYMAQGWAVSVCAAKFCEKTYAFLKTAGMTPQAFKMSLQKIRESRRISNDDKKRFSDLAANSQARMSSYSG